MILYITPERMKGLSYLCVTWVLVLSTIIKKNSLIGLIPIVYSIVNFLVFRALEQIRNDVVFQGVNVKFIATGVKNYFKFLGPSHCCDEDDKKIMQLINMRVFDPYERGDIDFHKIVE